MGMIGSRAAAEHRERANTAGNGSEHDAGREGRHTAGDGAAAGWSPAQLPLIADAAKLGAPRLPPEWCAAASAAAACAAVSASNTRARCRICVTLQLLRLLSGLLM